MVAIIKLGREDTDGNAVEFSLGGRRTVVTYAQLEGTRREKADSIKTILQAGADTRTVIADIPTDDVDRTTDPDRENHFHDGTDLVSREVIIESVEWDIERNRYNVVQRVAENVAR